MIQDSHSPKMEDGSRMEEESLVEEGSQMEEGSLIEEGSRMEDQSLMALDRSDLHEVAEAKMKVGVQSQMDRSDLDESKMKELNSSGQQEEFEPRTMILDRPVLSIALLMFLDNSVPPSFAVQLSGLAGVVVN
jgi:hypothetical protein